MKKVDKIDIWASIEEEGLDFISDNKFDEIEDVKFQKLRENFLKARKTLIKYIIVDNY
jgi:hypothetical protein